MPVFQEHPWLLYLCYAIAAMAVVYAIQMQLSLRPGAKPVRGIPVWREELQNEAALKLQTITHESHFRSTDEKGVMIESDVTPEAGGLFLHVRRTRKNSPPAPYNATVALGSGTGAISFRLSPLIPLIYVGLIIVVFMVFEGAWVGWGFAGLVVVLLLFTIGNMRSVILEAIRGMHDGNRVTDAPTVLP